MESTKNVSRIKEIDRICDFPLHAWNEVKSVHKNKSSKAERKRSYSAVRDECHQFLALVQKDIHSYKEITGQQRIELFNDFVALCKDLMKWVKQSMFGKSFNSDDFGDLLWAFIDLSQKQTLMLGIEADVLTEKIEEMKIALSQGALVHGMALTRFAENTHRQAVGKGGRDGKTGRKVGRTRVSNIPEEVAKRRKLKADWERYKETGPDATKERFCEDDGITVKYLNNSVLRWCRDHPT